MRRVDNIVYLPVLNAWLSAHHKNGIEARDLPALGFIEPGIAAGFLYQTDSSFGIMENFVANPEAQGRAVFFAINEIIQALCDAAQEHGIEKIFAFTQHRSMFRRVLDHGFASTPNRYFGASKEIN
jgi:hypothetical protein